MPLAWGGWTGYPACVALLPSGRRIYQKQLDVRKYAAFSRMGDQYDSAGQPQYSQVPQISTHEGGAGRECRWRGLLSTSVISPCFCSSATEKGLLEEVAVEEEQARYFRLKRASAGAMVWSLGLCVYAVWGCAGPCPLRPPSTAILRLSGCSRCSGDPWTACLLAAVSHAKRITLLSDNPTTIKDNLLLLVLTADTPPASVPGSAL